jgi:hypothetical protein
MRSCPAFLMASDCFSPGDNFLACAKPRMPGQPNRDYRDRCASVLSCYRPSCGAVRSPCSQPIESAFIGSAFTCASWIRPHLMHLTVQCSKPIRAAVMRWTSVRDRHLGQRGHAAPRAAMGCVFVDRATMPLVGSGQSAAKLSPSPTDADDRAAITVVCRLGITALWSILLTLGDLTLPSTIIAGGTLAGIRHWLNWRWRCHVITSKSKTVIGRAGYVSPRFA